MMNESVKVAIIKIDREKDIFEAVDKAISLIGGIKIRHNSVIAIKPNLCNPYSNEGAMTDVRIVEAVIQYLKQLEKTCQILIVESDSHSRNAEKAFSKSGFYTLKEKYDVALINLSKTPSFRVRAPENIFHDEIELSETLFFCDFFISIAKLKTSVDCRISCVLKNQFGCIPQKYKAEYHPYLSQVITTLNRLVKPDLSIIDGVIGMEDLGPTGGLPKRMNVIICSKDPVAADTVASRVMGMNPFKVPHLTYAAKYGVGTMNQIEVVGQKIEDVSAPFMFISDFGFNLIRLSYWVRKVADSGRNRLYKTADFVQWVGGAYGKRSQVEFLKRGFKYLFSRK